MGDLKKGGRGGCPMTGGEDLVENGDEFVFCSTCELETGHNILRTKDKGKGTDYLVQCQHCSNVHTIQIRPPKPTNVRFTLSEGSESFQISLEIDSDEIFSLGDEFEHNEALWEITRLEMPNATSSNDVSANKVMMVWATRTDVVMVRMTFSEGEYSFSDSIFCDPEREFKCGSIYEHQGVRWRIRALHSGKGRTLNGGMKAANIRRIFLHMPPSYDEAKERKKRERGRWKGQDFHGRDEHQQRVRESNIRSKKHFND
tara:strand:- start:1824 stop:2597 length:774 start_codon:yes stop_codon:yes gene_type:complete